MYMKVKYKEQRIFHGNMYHIIIYIFIREKILQYCQLTFILIADSQVGQRK